MTIFKKKIKTTFKKIGGRHIFWINIHIFFQLLKNGGRHIVRGGGGGPISDHHPKCKKNTV
jgi:hypothetical protein